MLDNADKTIIRDLLREVIKCEFSNMRKELGLTNEVSQAYAFRKYGEHYIKKWQKEGLKSHIVKGKRTRSYSIKEIDIYAAKDRLYQKKISDRKKAEKSQSHTEANCKL